MAGALNANCWGRLPFDGPLQRVESDWRFEALPDAGPGESLLACGARRSYGDSCINGRGVELGTSRLNRYIAFDREAGVLRCEAGLTLAEILRLTVPRGWFLPVLPGTRHVTVGGAIANDIHGKNHHSRGSFGCHVASLTLLRSDGQRYRCSADENPRLFAASIGGLGLTGVIVEAELNLRRIVSDRMLVENLVFHSAEEFSQLSRESMDWEYTVSWIDVFRRGGGVGRGIFSRAKHAAEAGPLSAGAERTLLTVPFAPPVPLVNRWTVDLFNRAYFWNGRRGAGLRSVHFRPFFFPLDAISHWNRVYGRGGFYQYQCVVPREGGVDAIDELLQRIAAGGEASFLAVLKEFGEQRSPGMLSFPRPGFTLALDFPNRGRRTLALLESLDEVVGAAGGALYPAKDARMSREVFARSFPQRDEFLNYVDPRFSSSFWRRVGGGT